MPFAPSAVDRSGEILAQGIMRGGDTITAAITKSQNDAKRLKALRAMAVDGLGMDPEAVDKMDEGTISGHLQSVAVKSAMNQMQNAQEDQGFQREAAGRSRELFPIQVQQMMQGNQFAAEDQGMQRDAAKRAAADATYQQQQRDASAAMMRDPALNGVGPTGPQEPDFSPQAIMGAASRAGVQMDPVQVMRVLEAGKNGKGFWNRGEADKPTQIAPGYLRVILGENQAQLVPDMSNAGKAVPITGPDGEDLGYGLPTRSGVQPLKTGDVTDKDQFTALQAEKRTLIAAKGKSSQSAAGAYDAAIAHIDGKLTELQAADKKGGAGKPKTVTTQAQYDALKSGDTYTGKDGQLYKKP